MIMELRGLFEEFRLCSISLLSILENEKYDDLESKIQERQDILDEINKIKFTKEEINKVVEELEILQLSEKIDVLINLKKNYLKTQIESISVKKNATSQYNKNFYNNYHVFSKKT